MRVMENAMYLEKIELANNSRKKVTRICDDCKLKEIVSMAIVWGGRKRRNSETDFCKKCSYKYRILDHPKMELSSSWNGGRYLNDNGYYRIYDGKNYIYEHKRIMEIFLKRRLTPQEQVHHIDMNKVNNRIENLFYCKNKKEHAKIHTQMEMLAQNLFGSMIWYDWKSHNYTIDNINTSSPWKYSIASLQTIMSIKTYKEARRQDGKEYLRFTNRKQKYGFQHISIMKMICGDIQNKIVHHVDGNTLNNDPSNLDIMDRSVHKQCHNSLQICIIALMKIGKIYFDKTKGEYRRVYE